MHPNECIASFPATHPAYRNPGNEEAGEREHVLMESAYAVIRGLSSHVYILLLQLMHTLAMTCRKYILYTVSRKCITLQQDIHTYYSKIVLAYFVNAYTSFSLFLPLSTTATALPSRTGKDKGSSEGVWQGGRSWGEVTTGAAGEDQEQ